MKCIFRVELANEIEVIDNDNFDNAGNPVTYNQSGFYVTLESPSAWSAHVMMQTMCNSVNIKDYYMVQST